MSCLHCPKQVFGPFQKSIRYSVDNEFHTSGNMTLCFGQTMYFSVITSEMAFVTLRTTNDAAFLPTLKEFSIFFIFWHLTSNKGQYRLVFLWIGFLKRDMYTWFFLKFIKQN